MNVLFKDLDGFTLFLKKKKDLYIETMMGNESTNNAIRKIFYNS